ncbi:uncharacterized protein LOC143903178 [Temnothorax americanus]|uniref:uncharacterized protein LOC143903178 n=1 Tax=Temnothorax americanus TaxID=1964332 RepID=UPI004068D5DE
MSELLVQQQALLHSISRSLENFKKIGKNNYTAAKIRSRITSLKETWSQCVQVNAQLLQACPEDNRAAFDYFKQHQFDAIEDIYQGTLDYMVECLEEIEPPRTFDSGRVDLSSSGHVHQRDYLSSLSLSHLPPINLPTFSGKCEEWESFRDRFTALIIDNKDLSAFARMHFLSSNLSGRALESIKTIPITADNFKVAWKTLTTRYENKRRLVEVHVAALYNLPTVSRESSFELNELRDKANRAVASLKNLKRSPEEMLSDILVYSVSQKLDPATRKAWKLKGGDDPTIPTYEDLDRFLTSRARALEESTPLNISKTNRSPKVTSATASPEAPNSCPICNASHYLNKCQQFMKKSPSQRLEMVKRFNRCLNYLSSKHAAQSCTSKYACRTCQKKHHSMLHVDAASSSLNSSENVILVPSTTQSDANDAPPSTAVALFSKSDTHARSPVLLATARVEIRSPSGRTCVARALLDQGSEVTFITGRLAQVLKMRRIKMPISISAVGCVDAGTCRYAAQIKIHPIGRAHPGLTTMASILNSLTNYSPAPISPHNSWSHLADLTLADPDPMNSDPINILIGADLYSKLILDGVRKGSSGQPIAQNTIFGWVLSDPMSTLPSSSRTITVQHCSSLLSLNRELRNFWEVEEVPRLTTLSPEDQQCEEHFLNTHSRCSDGRYVVHLPFKRGPPIAIGDSYHIAERCLKGLHRRLSNNVELKTEYTEFMREYERLGHMRQCPLSAPSSDQCV